MQTAGVGGQPTDAFVAPGRRASRAEPAAKATSEADGHEGRWRGGAGADSRILRGSWRVARE